MTNSLRLHARSTILIPVLLTLACASPRSSSPGSSIPVKNLPLVSQRSAERELQTARSMIDDGEVHAAIPRLQYTMVKFPNTRAALEARYLLAMSYHRIADYRDALDMLDEYLQLDPEGPHAEDARALARQIQQEYTTLFPGPEAIDRQVIEARDRLQVQPESPQRAAELADALWKRGNYDEAGAIYARIAADHPDAAAGLGVFNRIEFYKDNSYLILTPTEVTRRDKERRPLEIINLNSFRGARDSFSAVPRFYVVTGQAVNQSGSILYEVQVEVTIYGFGNVVYDTNTASLGRMVPGETRAFSVRFTNFEDINRIDRHEAIGRFQR